MIQFKSKIIFKLILLVITYAITSCSTSGSQIGPSSGSQKTIVWNEQNLKAWHLQQGEIQPRAADSGDIYLISDRKLSFSKMMLEFWIEHSTNSGVFFACQDPSKIHPNSCFEANIWDNHPKQQARTGSIVFKFMPPLVQASTIGKWNTMQIFVEGQTVTVMVNGEVTAKTSDFPVAEGYLALQRFNQGMVKFRNLRIQ